MLLCFCCELLGFLEGEGTFKSCQVHLLMSDDAGIPNFKRCHLPPLHDDNELASRMTLFQVGGDDAVRPTVIPTSSTLSSSPTYAKSSRNLKVNHILYASPIPTRLNGILLHTPSCILARLMTRSTGTREEARGLKDDKMEAWKRRRKKKHPRR